MNERNIRHVTTAAYSPQSNGQVERFNRDIRSIIAKLTSLSKAQQWDLVLNDTEFTVNNTVNRSINTTPSKVLFGINQRRMNDELENFVESINNDCDRNLNDIRKT